MKASRLSLLFVITLAFAFSACEKNAENIKNVSEVKAAASSSVVYPLIGTDTSGRILPMRKLPKAIVTKGFFAYPRIKVQLFDTVCADYLQKTTKVDLSGIADGAVTHLLGKDDIVYVDPDLLRYGVRKLSNGPKGWWTHWNYSPYTESETPIVLFPLDRRYGEKNPINSLSLSLRQRVKTFGFEIAPNETGKDIKVVVTYNDFGGYRGQTMFTVEQTISSPSGARLIAVKSSVPFNYVGIQLEDRVYPYKGFAIANLRYEL
jgi:hypothetical protein